MMNFNGNCIGASLLRADNIRKLIQDSGYVVVTHQHLEEQASETDPQSTLNKQIITPIGIALNRENAELLIGGRSYLHADQYGEQGSQITCTSFQEKEWFIVKKNEASSYVYCFNEKYIRKNWDKIQCNLEPKATAEIAKHFNLPVFPHIHLEAQSYKYIQYSSSHTTPYISLRDLRKNGTSSSHLIQEINRYNFPLPLMNKEPIPQCKLKATALPSRWLSFFQEKNIPTEHKNTSQFIRGEDSALRPDTVYILHHNHQGEDGQFLIVRENPDQPIQNIMNTERTQPDVPTLKLTQNLSFEKSLVESSGIQIGAMITQLISKAVEEQTTLKKSINTRTQREFSIVVTADPHLMELIQKIPYTKPLKIYNAQNISFLGYAFKNNYWYLNANTLDQMSPPERVTFQKSIQYTLNQLSREPESITRLFNQEGQIACLISGSPEVVKTMLTMEQHLS